MAPTTPYSGSLGDRDPLAALEDTPRRIAALVSGWTAAGFERAYAPGKWSARQVLAHLAHTDMALGVRVRMALTVSNYVAQPFDQDKWMERERDLAAPVALATFRAVAAMNAEFFAALSEAERQTAFAHPEYGVLTVDWVLHQMAGHQIHHLGHLQQIAQL